MSGRSALDSWRALGERLRAVDPERVAVGLVAGGAAVAVVAILFGGYVSFGDLLIDLLYPFALLLPVVGAALAFAAWWWVRFEGRSVPPILEGPPPEAGVTRTERSVGRETGWSLDFAARAWYRCETNNSATEIRTLLDEGAVRALSANLGLERGTAREAVRAGTWTDDPVAAAFLADDANQPVGERLRGAVDPGAAHRRRVRRTLEAIEAIEDGDGATDRATVETEAEAKTDAEVNSP